MKPVNAFGLPQPVANPILSLAADIIEQAASLGPGRWGLTPRKIGFRVNVGWTEIFTICPEHLRLIVCRDLMPVEFPKGVLFFIRARAAEIITRLYLDQSSPRFPTASRER